MAQVSQTWVEAEAMIEAFKIAFGRKFGVPVNVHYKLNNSKGLPQISLDDLHTIINDMFHRYHAVLIKRNTHKPVNIDEGIFSRTRKREVVIMRQLFFYIATELGYGPTHVARFTGAKFDHSSVIHGNKVVTNLLEVGDVKVIKLYADVKTEMRNKFERYNKDEEDKERDTK
jgi:chromosomal replication initiation ATPase DnaA